MPLPIAQAAPPMQAQPPQGTAQPAQTPQAAPTPQAPTPAQLPPPISNVADGSLPALRFPPEPRNRSLSPLSAFVAQNLDSIARAGVDFTEVGSGISVLFNPIKTSKEAIHKAYKENGLKDIPEVKGLAVQKRPTPARRTVHMAPVDLAAQNAAAAQAAGGAPQQGTPQAPVNSAGAPAQPPQAPPAPDDGHVRVDKKLLGQRASALKNEDAGTIQRPKSVVDRLSARAL